MFFADFPHADRSTVDLRKGYFICGDGLNGLFQYKIIFRFPFLLYLVVFRFEMRI